MYIPENTHEYLREHPIAYATHRVFWIEENNGTLTEKNEIPFITSVLFPFILFGYIVYSRLQHLLWIGRSTNVSENYKHLFTMSTTASYRTHSFVVLAKELNHVGEKSVLLCSPESEPNRNDWDQQGIDTISHRELHGRVAITALLRYFLKAALITLKVQSQVQFHTGATNLIKPYNYTLLELVKMDSTTELFTHNPSVHTYSPMPYLLTRNSTSDIYVYQHGIQWQGDWAMPPFIPLTYLIWSSTWEDIFRNHVHQDSTIEAVGSPWYDHLVATNEDRRETTDVLFVSGSHGTQSELERENYRSLVAKLVQISETNGWEFSIKLHPVEDSTLYEEWGFSDYIQEYEDIDEALQQTKMGITVASTAFIESAVLGTPIIVVDILNKSLSKLGPIKNVIFLDSPDDLEKNMMSIYEGSKTFADSKIVRLEGSTDRILAIVSWS